MQIEPLVPAAMRSIQGRALYGAGRQALQWSRWAAVAAPNDIYPKQMLGFVRCNTL